ncbi:hypothetical protein L195_g023430 [Trifolium pratense]|uniref:Uncharacterized protein n=1 Tax=Trifolium pratense TaxID=57577 RepID=A0A2K3NAU3_TRIPR|nr:hypothetical protein L195_g023430 [Trifolium pratense]
MENQAYKNWRTGSRVLFAKIGYHQGELGRNWISSFFLCFVFALLLPLSSRSRDFCVFLRIFCNFDYVIFFSLGLLLEYVGSGAYGGGCYGGSGGGRKQGSWYGGGRKEESEHEQNFELKILGF